VAYGDSLPAVLNIYNEGVDVRMLGVTCDGSTDDTAKFSDALQSAVYKNLYIPKGGAVKVTSAINVTAGVVECVHGNGQNSTISVNLAAFTDVINLSKNIWFENLTFDFNNGYGKYALRYTEGLGTIHLRDLHFKDMLDLHNTDNSGGVYILAYGNAVDIDGVKFSNMRKLGTGDTIIPGNNAVVVVGDSDQLCGICIDGEGYNGTTKAAIYASIRNVYAKDFHNVDINDTVVFKDTAVLYLCNSLYEGTDGHLNIDNIRGLEFGKRLMKIITRNGITVTNVSGETYVNNDSLGVVFTSNGSNMENFNVDNVIAKGKMSYAVATTSPKMNVSNVINKTTKPEAMVNNPTPTNYGILCQDNNINISNVNLECERPIGLVNLGSVIKNVNINNAVLTVIEGGSNGIYLLNGGAFETLNLMNITVNSKQTALNSVLLINLAGLTGNYNSTIGAVSKGRNLNIVNCFVEVGTLDNTGSAVYLNYVDGVDIDNLTIKNTHASGYLNNGVYATNCKHLNVRDVKGIGYINNIVHLGGGCDMVDIDTINAPTAINYVRCFSAMNSNIKIQNVDTGKLSIPATYCEGVLINGTNSGVTANRPLSTEINLSYYDTTIDKPVFCKTKGNRELDTLTLTDIPATASGNITIALDGVDKTIAVVSGDTATITASKIREAFYPGWITGGTGLVVTFKRVLSGTRSAPSFTDTDSTGITVTSFSRTTSGVAPAWVLADGTAA
jgi:hypothetical protein